jgi:hypothetical protein
LSILKALGRATQLHRRATLIRQADCSTKNARARFPGRGRLVIGAGIPFSNRRGDFAGFLAVDFSNSPGGGRATDRFGHFDPRDSVRAERGPPVQFLARGEPACACEWNSTINRARALLRSAAPEDGSRLLISGTCSRLCHVTKLAPRRRRPDQKSVHISPPRSTLIRTRILDGYWTEISPGAAKNSATL